MEPDVSEDVPVREAGRDAQVVVARGDDGEVDEPATAGLTDPARVDRQGMAHGPCEAHDPRGLDMHVVRG